MFCNTAKLNERKTMSPTFADKVREIRNKTGFTQAELGALLLVRGSTISQWENNKQKPYRYNVKAVNILHSQLVKFNEDLTAEQWSMIDNPTTRIKQTADRKIAVPCTEPLPLVNWWIPYGAISITAAIVAFGLWFTR